MRTLLVTCLIALLAGTASAQTTRTSTQSGTTKTSLSPQTKSRTSQPSDSKSAKTSTSTRSTQPTSQSRNIQSPTTRSTSARPSATTSQNATITSTARGISESEKKAPEVKLVNPVRVKWMTLEEALEKSKTDKRKIFVDVYTDWCSWCKRMDSTTFLNPAVVEYLNDHYYPVKFNAEQHNEVVFKDKTYEFKKNGAKGYHELAAEWLNNRLSYPTVVFLDENQSTIQPLQGYQDAEKMEAVLNYFGTDSHKKTPWESYQKNFKETKE